MSAQRSKIEVLEEIQPQSLLQEDQGGVIEISFKSNYEEEPNQRSNQYPQISNGSGLDSRTSGLDSRDDQLGQVVKGVKRSSYNIEDSISSDMSSFSGLNYSLKEEDMAKSTLKQQPSQVKKEEKHDPAQEKEMMKMFNQSMFTSKFQPNRGSKQKQSPEKEYIQPVNYDKSFYMTDTPAVVQNKIKQKQKVEQIQLKLISKAYILEYKGLSIQANKVTLNSIYHELFKKQIFIPKFNSQRYDQWELNKYQVDSDIHLNFKIYLQRYVNYLNEICLAEMEVIIKRVQEIQQGVSSKKHTEGFSLFNLDFNALIDHVKHYISSSKYQVLRRTLLAKQKTLRQALQFKQIWKLTQKQEKVINRTVQQIWRDIGEVQLLINFEETEEYCRKQMEGSSELKFKEIWVKCRDVNRKQMKRIATTIDTVYL